MKIKNGFWEDDLYYRIYYKGLIIGIFNDIPQWYVKNRNKIIIEFCDLFDKWAEWKNYYSKEIPSNIEGFKEIINDIKEIIDNFEYHFGKSLTYKKYGQEDELSKEKYIEICKKELKRIKEEDEKRIDVINNFIKYIEKRPEVINVYKERDSFGFLNINIILRKINDKEFEVLEEIINNKVQEIEKNTKESIYIKYYEKNI